MISFDVPDMTCGHCVASVTRAVQAVDAKAEVAIDLSRHRVDITTDQADGEALTAAIADAGFTPTRVGA